MNIIDISQFVVLVCYGIAIIFMARAVSAISKLSSGHWELDSRVIKYVSGLLTWRTEASQRGGFVTAEQMEAEIRRMVTAREIIEFEKLKAEQEGTDKEGAADVVAS